WANIRARQSGRVDGCGDVAAYPHTAQAARQGAEWCHCPCRWVSDTFRCQTPCIRGMDTGAATASIGGVSDTFRCQTPRIRGVDASAATASVGGCLTPSGVRHRAFAVWTRVQPLPLLV